MAFLGCIHRELNCASNVFQVPSQLAAERVGVPLWIAILMVGWGLTASLFAGLTRSPTHLYILRFLLGRLSQQDSCAHLLIHGSASAINVHVCHLENVPDAGALEAGTFPAMWAHLTRFYAGGPELAVAWGFIGAAQPLAQVTHH